MSIQLNIQVVSVSTWFYNWIILNAWPELIKFWYLLKVYLLRFFRSLEFQLWLMTKLEVNCCDMSTAAFSADEIGAKEVNNGHKEYGGFI